LLGALKRAKPMRGTIDFGRWGSDERFFEGEDKVTDGEHSDLTWEAHCEFWKTSKLINSKEGSLNQYGDTGSLDTSKISLTS
jgi:hypothetical protein